MSEAVQNMDDIAWTMGYASRALLINERTLYSLVKNAGYIPVPSGGRDAVRYRASEIVEAVIKRRCDQAVKSISTNHVEPNDLPPRDRKSWYDSELARLNYEQRCSELVHIDEYRDALSATLKEIQELLETLPDVIERKAQADPKTLEAIQNVIDEQRHALANRLETIEI